jgi:hypothetical protein
MYSLINLDLRIFIKSNGVYSSLFWINVGISRPSRRTWWLLLTLKYKDNRYVVLAIIISCSGYNNILWPRVRSCFEVFIVRNSMMQLEFKLDT